MNIDNIPDNVFENIETRKIIEAIKKDGPSSLWILADFDKTLTTAFVDGILRPSLLSVLRDGGYLTANYAQEAHSLYDKYHAIEIDGNISYEEKKKAMEEWWARHFELLIKCGLSKTDLEQAVISEKVKFRPGFEKFIKLITEKQVPLVIVSSSGAGKESIGLYFKKLGKLNQNIFIIGNSYVWDATGKAIGINKPIIHSLNKDTVVIKEFPEVYKMIKERKNIILLGDNPEDILMANGAKYKNILKIGFLNEEVEKKLKQYKKAFDVIVANDGPMDYINNLLHEFLK